MSEVKDLWRRIKALFAGYLDDEQKRAIKDVDSWDGSAARFDSTEAYCNACLINVNPAAGRSAPEDWAQSHCMLPVRGPDDAADVVVRQAVHAAAGGHGISRVQRPEDVPEDEWEAAVKRAANRLLEAYAEMEEDAPEALYTLAGKKSPQSERALAASQIYEMLYHQADAANMYLVDLFVEDGQFYAIANREGQLYRAPVVFTAGEATLGDWQPVEVQHVPLAPGVTVTRQADGRWRWTGIACSAVLNKNAQIDSTALFRRFVERFNQRDADATDVPLDFWHTDIELGRVDFLGTDGYVLIDSGVLRDDAIGEAVARSLQEHPEAWGQSIAYTPLSPPSRLDVGAGMTFPVWEDGQLRRVALLPQDQAAAWFTTIQRSMNMEPKILEALKKLVGEEQALALAAQVDGVNRRVEHEQLIAREAEGAASKSDATPTPSETPEAPEVRAVLEIRAALAESNAALAEVVHAITDMDARLQLLERSEQQRREAWLADLPVLQPRELARPRDVRPAEAAEKQADERVRETLSQKGIVI